jgi:hypothetical protein
MPRIEFELRKIESEGRVELVEKAPYYAYDGDLNSEDAVTAVLKRCSGCPLVRECQPLIIVSPKGFLRKNALTVTGSQVESDACLIKNSRVNFNSRPPGTRYARLNELTEQGVSPQGFKTYRSKI